MTTPILEVQGLSKGYGGRSVLRGIDLALQPGEHLGLIGNNGQGKTTLIRLMLGLLRPDGGQVCLNGQPAPVRRPATLKRMIGYLPEQVQFYPNLTGRRTLVFLARLKRVPVQEVDAALAQVGLAEAANVRVKRYSKGMRQRLGLAQALLGQPALLLLDEPTNGLDPEGIHMFYGILRRLRAEGTAIITASHLLSEIESRLDRLAVLRDGRFTHIGTLPELLAAEGVPTVIRFALQDPQAGLPNTLAELAPLQVGNGTGPAFEVHCARERKFDVLGRLMAHQGRLRSLVVQDPGLEELFRRIHHPSATEAGAVQTAPNGQEERS